MNTENILTNHFENTRIPTRSAVADLKETPKVERAITIGRSVDEVFAFWRDFSNLSLFMKDIDSIIILSPIRSKWTVKLKSGLTVEWIAEITGEEYGRLIAWESVEGTVETKGVVTFSRAPANLGTVVTLAMDYKIPGGKLAELAALFTGEDPENLIQTNLKRLKGYLETGEIATVEGQPSGREEEKSEEKTSEKTARKTFH